jgi:serine/threonine-protein phosphatase 5
MISTDSNTSIMEQLSLFPPLSDIPQDQIDKAEALKTEANQEFKNGKYWSASHLYSEAIKLNPYVPSYWSNRSFAHLKLENYGYAIRDADKALELDPSYLKVFEVIAHFL